MRPRIGSNRLWKLIKAAVENMGRKNRPDPSLTERSVRSVC